MGGVMVDRWAMILSGVVDNVCLWDGNESTWRPPEGCLMQPIPDGSGAGIGWGWDGTDFVAPEQPPNLALDQPGTAPDVIQ